MPAQLKDPADRLRDLSAKWEPRLRRRFLEMVETAKSRFDLDELAALIETGQVTAAVELVASTFAAFSSQLTLTFTDSAEQTAAFLTDGLKVRVEFDRVNAHAVSAMQRNQLDFVREMTQSQIATARAALVEGVRRGANPIEQARAFRDSIGLTATQEGYVRNYQRALEGSHERAADALSRELRDRRFDRTVSRARSSGQPLSRTEVDRMVTRYRERWIKHRAQVIARTEALSAVHQGASEMYDQAMRAGLVQASDLTETWSTAHDGKVRSTHASINGVAKPPGEPWITSAGNQLRFPGDPNAPASERVHCRCAVQRRISL